MPDINIDPNLLHNHESGNGKKILIGIAVLVGVILLYFGLQKFKILPDFASWFKKKEVKIDATPLILMRVRDLAEMTTVTAMDEVVVNEFKQDNSNVVKAFWNNPSLDPNHRKLTLIIKGKLRAGIDFKLLTPQDITISQDTILMKLPKAKVLDVIVNPSDVRIFNEKGEWSTAEMSELTLEGKAKMEKRAIAQKILERSDVKAKAVMESLLRNLGYTSIAIESK